MDEVSNTYRMLCILKRMAKQLDNLTDILSRSNATGCSSLYPFEEDGEIRYRVRKSPYDHVSQVAATYSLERAIQLCPVGYSVYNEDDEVMFKNIGAM